MFNSIKLYLYDYIVFLVYLRKIKITWFPLS